MSLVVAIVNLHTSIGDANFSDDLDVSRAFTGRGTSKYQSSTEELRSRPRSALCQTEGTIGSVEVSRRKRLVHQGLLSFSLG